MAFEIRHLCAINRRISFLLIRIAVVLRYSHILKCLIHDFLEYRSCNSPPAKIRVPRFINQNDHCNLGIINWRITNKGYNLFCIIIYTFYRLNSRTRFTGNPVSFNVGMTPCTNFLVGNNLLQIAADFFCLLGCKNLTNYLFLCLSGISGLWIRNGFDNMRLQQSAPIGNSRYSSKLLQRGNKQLAVTVRHCRKVRLLLRCNLSFSFTRKLDACLLTKPEFVDILLKAIRTQHFIAQLYECNVTGALDALHIGDRSPAGSLKVMDRLSRNPDATRHVCRIWIKQAFLHRTGQGYDFKG
ncbi:hypothetical protein D3C81_1197200 [compost metagenome]